MKMSNRELYDCIVIGLGAHGSCACARLAKHGANVLGIEQFEDVTHSYGSSHGKSRIIRTAYFESPKYVPLVQRSLELWQESQQEYVDLQRAECTSADGVNSIDPCPLLVLSGCLIIGKKSTMIVKGTLRSAREHNLPHDVLSASEIRRRYGSIFNVGVEDIGVFERGCGYLVPEICISAHIKLAQKHGCTTKYGERMLSWEETEENGSPVITVKTDKGSYRTRKLVLSVGAWAPEIYGQLIAKQVPLQCERRILWWVDPLRSAHTLDAETATAPHAANNDSAAALALAVPINNPVLSWIRNILRWSLGLFGGLWGRVISQRASVSIPIAPAQQSQAQTTGVSAERAQAIIETCKVTLL